MSAVAFANAVKALMPPGVTVYDGQVFETAGVPPALPWARLTVRLPYATDRTLGRPAALRAISVRVLVAAGTADGVRIIADSVDAALEDARPVVPGWSTTALELVNERPPEEDDDVTLVATGRQPMVGVLEYQFTASPVQTP